MPQSKLDQLREKMTLPRTPPPSQTQQQQSSAANVVTSSAEDQHTPADQPRPSQATSQQPPPRTVPTVPQPGGTRSLEMPPPPPVGATGGPPPYQPSTTASGMPEEILCYEPNCFERFTNHVAYQRHLNQVHPVNFGDEDKQSVVSYSSEYGDIPPYPIKVQQPLPNDPEFLNKSDFYTRNRSAAGYARSFKNQAKKFTNAFNANGSDAHKKRVFKDLKDKFNNLVMARGHAEELLTDEQLDHPKYAEFLIKYEEIFESCERQYLDLFPESEEALSNTDIMESTNVNVADQQLRHIPPTSISEIPPTVNAMNLNTGQVPTCTGTVPRLRTVGFRTQASTGHEASRANPVSGDTSVTVVNTVPRINTGFNLPPTNTVLNAPINNVARNFTNPPPGYMPHSTTAGHYASPHAHHDNVSYEPPIQSPMNPNVNTDPAIAAFAGGIHALVQTLSEQGFDIKNQIIPFDGTVNSYLKWKPVWYTLWKKMKEQLRYDDYRIFTQFLNSMEPKIANQYRHLDPSEKSVQSILDNFQSEFGNLDKLHYELYAQLRRFAEVPLVLKDLDKAKVRLSILETLHQNFLDNNLITPENGNTFIVAVEAAMPFGFKQKWAEYTDARKDRVCTSIEWIERLKAFFRVQCRIRAATTPASSASTSTTSTSSSSNQPKSQQRNQQQGSVPRSFATKAEENSADKSKFCIICHKEPHGPKRSLKCPELKSKTPKEVCELVMKNKACFLCLQVGHRSSDCKSGLQACSMPGPNDGKCGKMHCRAAHVEPDKATKAKVHLTNEESAEQEATEPPSEEGNSTPT